MKKFFIAITVLVALTFFMVPAQANMGLPDDVPGCDAVLPFLVGMTAPAINTLVVFTDVRGYGTPVDMAVSKVAWNFHYTVNTITSVTVYNSNLPGTDFDIVSTDAYSILMQMTPSARTMLEIDLDGDGVNDHWAGYIEFELAVMNGVNNPFKANQMIGQTLLLNIQQGQTAAANTWFREFSARIPFPMTDFSNLEQWSANSLAHAEQSQVGVAAGARVNADAFGLYPRFYINDANANTCLFIWKEVNWRGILYGEPYIPWLHIYMYDNEEHKVSTNIPVPYELNIVCLDPNYLPHSLFTSYPMEGWIALEVRDLSNVGFYGDLDWAGYTWSFATGAASESWSYLTQIHRDVSWDNSWDSIR